MEKKKFCLVFVKLGEVEYGQRAVMNMRWLCPPSFVNLEPLGISTKTIEQSLHVRDSQKTRHLAGGVWFR